MEFQYQEKQYTVDESYYNYLNIHGLKEERCYELLAKSIDSNIDLDLDYIKLLCNAEHKEHGNEFIQNYGLTGGIMMPVIYSSAIKAKLVQEFCNDSRFHGRVPRIINAIAIVATYFDKYNYHPTNLVSSFHIQTVQTLLNAKISPIQTVLLYQRFNSDHCRNIASQPKLAKEICSLIAKGIKKNNLSLLKAADWLMDHRQSDDEFLKKVIHNSKQIDFIENNTVDGIKAQLSALKSIKEVERIEKAYKKPKFKFSECTCELKDINKKVIDGSLTAYIMEPTDTRQAILGYATNCCQHLGDAGESSMMHGLLNPKAGFFIIEDSNTKEIKAQAEIWEQDENTLVFDNIEYANDCDISLYRTILSKWLQETSYVNVKMGTGYNNLSDTYDFRNCGALTPTITAREAYVMSYEDEIEIPNGDESLEELESEEKAQELIDNGTITYYTYLYCDSEHSAVWLKENGRLETYFQDQEQNLSTIMDNIRGMNQLLLTSYDNCVLDACFSQKIQNLYEENENDIHFLEDEIIMAGNISYHSDKSNQEFTIPFLCTYEQVKDFVSNPDRFSNYIKEQIKAEQINQLSIDIYQSDGMIVSLESAKDVFEFQAQQENDYDYD